MQPGPLNPASLLPGTRVGSWQIVDARGSGTFGSVYLAEGPAGTVALKVFHHPWNPRFNREVELLSRLRHPCVPRLIDHGQWVIPGGVPHAFIVMELVDGIPLYVWASAFAPTSRQVLQVLAQLARALEATHAVGGVHRDVKGDNALVQPKDGQAFLIDFGSSTYEGAPPLTQPVFPPGTEPYRSPEAFRFGLGILKSPVKVYSPRPAEDVFALGVTAYKLVTGEYPPRAEPTDANSHVWKTEGPGPQPASELNARCCEELSDLISRMLSRQPEARGSARELAEALEHAAQAAGPEADASLFHRAAPEPEEEEATSPHGQPWLVAAVLVGLLILGTIRELLTSLQEGAAREEQRDAGSVAVGDAVLTAPAASPHESSVMLIGLDMPDKPLPWQARPDAQGRCARDTQVAINGGCWIKVNIEDGRCPKDGYVYKGGCYEPAYPPPRPNTSCPTESRDGGT
jgi:serine/threonine-protein kinase